MNIMSPCNVARAWLLCITSRVKSSDILVFTVLRPKGQPTTEETHRYWHTVSRPTLCKCVYDVREEFGKPAIEES